MKKYRIDSYHYCNDNEKEKFYREHVLTSEEKQKTDEFMKKMNDFVIKTGGKNRLQFFHNQCSEGTIHYREKIGYITVVNYDRDFVEVYGYGKTVDEAFLNATIDYENSVSQSYELSHREELNRQYSKRFLNGDYQAEDYHGPFFFAELALQDFRKYYGINIPDEIISYYQNYLKEVDDANFKYDYETNRLVKADTYIKLKSKKH